MTPTEFTAAVRALSAGDIRAVAASLDQESAGDEVDMWRATIAIDRALRHTHRSRQAAHAAWDAAQAVQFAGERAGITLPDAAVTLVARAAAEVARGMVAGDDVVSDLSRLLVHWFPALAARV